jgi:hypothetical protein
MLFQRIYEKITFLKNLISQIINFNIPNMKLYKIIFFDPNSPDILHEDIIKAKNEILARELVNSE